MKTYLKGLIVTALILIPTLLTAQKNGEVNGHIYDAALNEPIAYANIQLMGTSIGTTSNEEGFYTIKNAPPGTYMLKVSYVGYSGSEASVEVLVGEVITQDFSLVLTSIQGEEVTITAMARGQAKAINTQLAAENIKNVVSEQKIRELPDANAAEALARLPGVSVIRSGGEAIAIKVRGVSSNTMFVNGMRLDGGLASISSSMIGSIELSKAFMADQDADVLGGNVDFKMREARPGFRKDIWFRTGYNGFTNSFKMQDLSLLLSNRFFDDRLGVMLSLNYDRKDRGRDVLSAGYETRESSTTGSEDILNTYIRSANLQHSQNLNKRYGATLYTDFRLENGKLFYQAFFSQLNSENYSLNNSYSNAASTGYSSNYYLGSTKNFLQGIGGEHTFLGAKVDWGVSMSGRRNEVPERLYYTSGNGAGMIGGPVAIDSSTTISEYLDLANHSLEWIEAGTLGKEVQSDYSDELAARLNVEVPFRLGSKIDGYLKFGGKVRDMQRGYERNLKRSSFNIHSGDQIGNEAMERLPDWNWTTTPAGEFGGAVFVAEPYEQDFSMLGAKTYYLPDFDKVNEVADVVDDLLNPMMYADIGDYSNSERYYAGYIMVGIDIGSFITFTPGIRYEKYDYTTTAKWSELGVAYGPYGTQGFIEDTTAGHFNEQFFPMIHLKIKPTNWFDIRLAATKTMTRPGFTQMSPRYNKAASLDINRGDIYLMPQINYNYDIYFSFYTGKIGLFTVGAFYKKLENQVLNYTVRIIDPEDFDLPPIYKNKNYTAPQNNQWPGYVKGLEIDWQTHFSYLPKPFNGILLNMNLTYMQSETRYPFYSFTTIYIDEPPYKISEGKQDSRVNKIIGMPDLIANVALGYELGGFSGRISAYYQGSTITTAQASNKSLDQDKDELLRLDMQFSQKFKKVPGLVLYLNINNITNNPDRRILTYYPEKLVRQEMYGVSGDIGVRYKF